MFHCFLNPKNNGFKDEVFLMHVDLSFPLMEVNKKFPEFLRFPALKHFGGKKSCFVQKVLSSSGNPTQGNVFFFVFDLLRLLFINDSLSKQDILTAIIFLCLFVGTMLFCSNSCLFMS